VAVSGHGEFADLIESGAVRALAISSPERIPGRAIPTLREAGIPIDLANWRGVVAPPGILAADRQAVTLLLERVVRSPAWQAELARRDWEDLWLPGEAFGRFLAADRARIEALARLKAGARSGGPASTWTWPAVVLMGLVLGLAAIAREPPSGPGPSGPGRRRVAAILAGVAANLALINPLGFVPASTVLFGVTATAMGESPRRSFLVGIGYSLAVFLVFRLGLGVGLPLGTIWEAIR
jgi:hypothetical protein